jgi:hypothetical protein
MTASGTVVVPDFAGTRSIVDPNPWLDITCERNSLRRVRSVHPIDADVATLFGEFFDHTATQV